MSKPMLVERDGRFFAHWTHDDETMRSYKRSILERLDRIESVDDAFIDALRSDDAEVKWKSKEDIEDLKRRLEAWRLVPSVDKAVCAKVAFVLTEPEVKKTSRRKDAFPEDAQWKLEAKLADCSRETLLALGASCRAYFPLRGMSGRTLELEQSEVESFLRVGAPALKAAGYSLELPEYLAAEVQAEAEMVAAEKKANSVSAKNVKAKITVRVAGEKVSAADIAFLLDQGSSVVFFRGRWIEVDRAILKNALKVLDADGKKCPNARRCPLRLDSAVLADLPPLA